MSILIKTSVHLDSPLQGPLSGFPQTRAVRQPIPAPEPDLQDALLQATQNLQASVKPARDRIIKTTRRDARGKEITDITILGTPEQPAIERSRRSLHALQAKLQAQDLTTQQTFAQHAAHIQKHHLPKVIADRHAAAQAQVQQRSQQLQTALQSLQTQQNPFQLHRQAQDLARLLQSWQPPAIPFDPQNLPFRSPEPKVRQPATSEADLRRLLAFDSTRSKSVASSSKTRVATYPSPFGRGHEPAPAKAGGEGPSAHRHAQNLRTPSGYPATHPQARQTPITPAHLAQIQASAHPYPEILPDPILLATTGSTAGLGSAPGPEYLQATADAPLSDAIRAKAAELHHNPVEIYNWVRNTVDYLPSYGSIQGAELTLSAQRGNAFDTASLLIALLRASHIPARYVYGTIEIPAAQANNWVGGTTNANASQQLLSQGGIPNTALTSGGQTVAIRLEQVWVEAWVDFSPSRGAHHQQGDAWVPLDASYKQYQYSPGMDLQTQVPFDAQAFLAAAQQGATINESQGSIQNLNHSNIQTQLQDYQTRLQTHLEQQSPNATVGDVLGKKIIPQNLPPTLAASLPYKTVLAGARYSQLPSSLQQHFTYGLYFSPREIALENPIWEVTIPTVELAQQKLTLSWQPSSDEDRQTLESYLPKPHADGSPIQPEEFPKSLPAYGIYVTPQLKRNGQIIASGGSFTLGTELTGQGSFKTMNLQAPDASTDMLVAGQTGALGVSLHGISANQLNSLKARLQSTQQILQNQDETQLQTLTGEQLSGDLLTAVVWSYLASVENFGRIAQTQANMVDNPGLSYGFFHAMAVPIKSRGIAMTVEFPGVLMDVGHGRRMVWSKDNDPQAWIPYNKLRGTHASAMEHAIPEAFFNDPNATETQRTEGVSAVKALAIAAQQGQKIYTITQANQDQIQNLQHSPRVIDNIRNALNSGMEVTIHERALSHAGFNGAGYIITDPQTGAGAYMIEGGGRGGIIIHLIAAFLAVGAFFILLPYVALIASFLTAWIGTAAAFYLLAGIASYGAFCANEGSPFKNEDVGNIAYGLIITSLTASLGPTAVVAANILLDGFQSHASSLCI